MVTESLRQTTLVIKTMNKYFKYGNGGGIDKVIDREEYGTSGFYSSIHELLKSIDNPDFKIDTCRIKYHAYDERLNRHVYMVLHDTGAYKQQFVCFFIED